MEHFLVEIIRKADIYKETGSESIRQELVNLEVLAENKFIELGSPDIYKGCLSFIHRYLAKVV